MTRPWLPRLIDGEDRVPAFTTILVVLCLSVSSIAAAQSVGAISATVLDETGASLSDARVTLTRVTTTEERVATTGADGRVVFANLPLGRYAVLAERQGFTAVVADAEISTSTPTVVVGLTMKVAGFSGAVVVTADPAVGRAAPSSIDVRPSDVRGVAGGAENIFRTLQTLPGVAAVNEFDSRVAVRGGGPDQNLTIMDGVEIHNPYRLFGLTSAFNPETIANFELTAGGFSAKYGDRLSSLLIVENRDGDARRTFGGSSALTITDGNLVAEGRVPGLSNASFLVTGRRTYYDLIADSLAGTDLPGFADVQLRAAWEPMTGHRFTLFGLGSREGADATFDADDGTGERAAFKSKVRNALGGATWSALVGDRISNRLTLSWYRNVEDLNFDGDFRDSDTRSNAPNTSDTPPTSILFTRNLVIGDVALRNELSLRRGQSHVLDTGFEFHRLHTEWSWRIPGSRNVSEPNGSSIQGGVGLPSVLDSSRSNTRAGAWVTDRWTLAPTLKLEPGLRVDWSGLAGETTVSPRLAVTLDVGPRTKARLSGGLFTQSPGYEKLLQSDYFVDLSDADDLDLKSERAWHLVGGLERTLGNGTTARVEGYYKRFDQLIIGQLETDQARATRVATYDFPAELASSIPTSPIVTSIPGNTGKGRSYGVEVYVVKRATSASTRLTGWLSYEVGRAETTAYGRTYRSDYDRPYALSLVANYQLSRRLAVATTIRAQSGFPDSAPRGLRVAGVEDVMDADRDGQTTEIIPRRDLGGRPVWIVDYGSIATLNSARLPAFARVDVRLAYTPGWQQGRWLLYLEVINLLNRENAGQLKATLEYDPNSDRPTLTRLSDFSLPRLPSIGVRFRW